MRWKRSPIGLTMYIPLPSSGRALIAVEDGSLVLEAKAAEEIFESIPGHEMLVVAGVLC